MTFLLMHTSDSASDVPLYYFDAVKKLLSREDIDANTDANTGKKLTHYRIIYILI